MLFNRTELVYHFTDAMWKTKGRSFIPQKWYRLSKLQRWIIVRLIILAAILILLYNCFTSELYLRQLDEKISISQPERARCCLSEDLKEDICGRSDCLWPCPAPPPREHGEMRSDNNNGFFLETSGRSSLTFRQACSVESLAKHNPEMNVHVLMIGNVDMEAVTMKKLVESYSNIKILHIELGEYVAGTPLEKWYHCTNWNRGWYAVSHLSDALRFLTLQKYGGLYSDLDIIQLRPMASLRNFVVEEGTGKLGSSVVHVQHGHPFIEKSMEAFPADYKWYVWAHNGPDLITRVLQDLCNDYDLKWMTPERCQGFHVLPVRTFYPVHWMNWRHYFYPRENYHADLNDWEDGVIGAHVWNSRSSEYKVVKNSNQYYAQMARQSCPEVLSVAPDEF